MKNKFKIGDRVRIRKSSEYYGVSASNPSDCEGVVTEVGVLVCVNWDNGTDNCYRPDDIKRVKKSKKRIDRLETRADKIEEQIKPKPPTSVIVEPMADKPSRGALYWNLNLIGVTRYTWSSDAFDNGAFNSGNCYATKQIAELALKRSQLIQTMRIAAKKAWADEGKVLDWGDEEQEKWVVYWGFRSNNCCITSRRLTSLSPLPCFPSKKSLTDFMETLPKSDQRLLVASIWQED